MQLQPQMIAAVIIAAIGPWIASHGIATSDQFATWVNGTITFVTGVAIPLTSAVYAWWQTQHPKLIAATAAIPGVSHVAMVTDAGAAAIGTKGDKVLGPSEIPAAVVSMPGVKAVVMQTESAAKAIPNDNVVGPSKLAA